MHSFGLWVILIGFWGSSPGLPPGAPVDPVPWEQGEALDTFPAPSRHGLLARVELGLIGMYQRGIGPRSISRCPFRVSCSRYAELAVQEKGSLLGLLYALDRYFIRENASAFVNYPRIHNPDGLVRLDDGWFLLGEP